MSRVGTVVRRSLLLVAALLVAGLFLPESGRMPVVGASKGDWHPDTFWSHPWGRSGVHKGVDIFAIKGTPVVASSAGIVLFRGELARGGKVVLMLGPKWRLHYYAHLDQTVGNSLWLDAGEQLGAVGDTGNAAGKPPHLHYSLVSLLPLIWKADGAPQGWKKMFYLDPLAHFGGADQ